MKTISLWQPWASAIALGCKRIETRHWSTHYRGALAIHAAKRWTLDEREFARRFADAYDVRLREPPLGAIVAICRLAAVRRSEDLLRDGVSEMEQALGNFSPKRFGWILADIQPLSTPVPYTGHQGLFDATFDEAEPARAQGQLL